MRKIKSPYDKNVNYCLWDFYMNGRVKMLSLWHVKPRVRKKNKHRIDNETRLDYRRTQPKEWRRNPFNQ